MKILGIIPARFASSRFPGKPLAQINGKSMIEYVYRGAGKSTKLFDLIVATDDQKIYDAVIAFGGRVMMTADTHTTGTSRCLEVSNNFPEVDWIINIQGDEPLISYKLLDQVIQLIERNTGNPIITMVRKMENIQDALNPNLVKCVFDQSGKALYFSRNPIPYFRDKYDQIYYQHIGIYAFRKNILDAINNLEPTHLELAESLEQLRWLENGLSIQTGLTEYKVHGVDVPEDIPLIEHLLNTSL